jgi:1-acyl-sn-glycerol-3-phosphate acyltransferase
VPDLRRWPRIAATGLCFTAFGLGGLALGLVIAPVLDLVAGDRARRVRHARWLVLHFFRFFIWLMKSLRVLSYETEGLERLHRPGLLVVANHPSLIDVIFVLALLPQASCVVKSSLARNPFTRGPVSAAGYVTNDEGLAMLEDCRRQLAMGETLLIFPEGTRTPLDGRIELQRGAANVAIRCRKAVTPVTIQCKPRGLAKGQRWYDVPPRRMHFTIRVHEDLPLEPFLGDAVAEPAAARRLNARLTHFLQQEAGRGAT